MMMVGIYWLMGKIYKFKAENQNTNFPAQLYLGIIL